MAVYASSPWGLGQVHDALRRPPPATRTAVARMMPHGRTGHNLSRRTDRDGDGALNLLNRTAWAEVARLGEFRWRLIAGRQNRNAGAQGRDVIGRVK